MSAEEQALWRAILEDPDAPGPWLVLGDFLISRGDPRGELVALQASVEQHSTPAKREAVRRCLFDHREVLLGPLFAEEPCWTGRWRFGFLEDLAITVDHMTERTADTLTALCAQGGLRPLRKLRLCSTANFDRAVWVLNRNEWPLLERLELGPMSVGAGRVSTSIAPFLERAPKLKFLRLELPEDLAEVRHARLEQLTISIEPHQLPDLDLDALPRLTRLTLYARETLPPDVFRTLRSRPFERLELHAHCAEGWLAKPAAPVDTLVLHERGQALHRVAERRARVVQNGSSPSADRDPLLTPTHQKPWRRFARAERFWQIRREGSNVHFRYGKLGKRGTERSKALRSPYEAARDYRERVSKKRREGYSEIWLNADERSPTRG